MIASSSPSCTQLSLLSSSRGEQLTPSTMQISLTGRLMMKDRKLIKSQMNILLVSFEDTECVIVAICLLLHLKCYIKMLNSFFFSFLFFFPKPTLLYSILQSSNLPGNTLDFPGPQPSMLCARGEKVLGDVEKTSELPVSVYKLGRCPPFLS